MSEFLLLYKEIYQMQNENCFVGMHCTHCIDNLEFLFLCDIFENEKFYLSQLKQGKEMNMKRIINDLYYGKKNLSSQKVIKPKIKLCEKFPNFTFVEHYKNMKFNRWNKSSGNKDESLCSLSSFLGAINDLSTYCLMKSDGNYELTRERKNICICLMLYTPRTLLSALFNQLYLLLIIIKSDNNIDCKREACTYISDLLNAFVTKIQRNQALLYNYRQRYKQELCNNKGGSGLRKDVFFIKNSFPPFFTTDVISCNYEKPEHSLKYLKWLSEFMQKVYEVFIKNCYCDDIKDNLKIITNCYAEIYNYFSKEFFTAMINEERYSCGDIQYEKILSYIPQKVEEINKSGINIKLRIINN